MRQQPYTVTILVHLPINNGFDDTVPVLSHLREYW